MKSKLNLECLSERITPSAGVDNPGVTDYSGSAPPAPTPVPPGVIPTRAEGIEKGDKLVAQLKVESDFAVLLVTDLRANEKSQSDMKKIIADPTKTQVQRDTAKMALDGLIKEHDELVDLLVDTVNKYRKLEGEYIKLQSLMNEILEQNIRFPKIQNLPSDYDDFLPDPRLYA